MSCTFLTTCFIFNNGKKKITLKHLSLKMLPVKQNEPTVYVRVPLKINLFESSDGLTFMAPAESIKKSNQGMLPRVQNQIMSERKGLSICGQHVKSGQHVKYNLINWQQHHVCFFLYTLKEHLRLYGSSWLLIIPDKCT